MVNGWIWIARGEWGFAGYVVNDGVTIPVSHINRHAEYHEDMTRRRFEADRIDINGGVTRLEMDSFGLIKLPTNEKAQTEIWEVACDATIDGEQAAGQFETHWSSQYVRHLVESNK